MKKTSTIKHQPSFVSQSDRNDTAYYLIKLFANEPCGFLLLYGTWLTVLTSFSLSTAAETTGKIIFQGLHPRTVPHLLCKSKKITLENWDHLYFLPHHNGNKYKKACLPCATRDFVLSLSVTCDIRGLLSHLNNPKERTALYGIPSSYNGRLWVITQRSFPFHGTHPTRSGGRTAGSRSAVW